MFRDPPQGDGKCSACHGTGMGEFFDSAVVEMLNGEQPACEECGGTGKCPTCCGAGMLEEPVIRTAA
jgi:DnaJ-class molecular chaperone